MGTKFEPRSLPVFSSSVSSRPLLSMPSVVAFRSRMELKHLRKAEQQQQQVQDHPILPMEKQLLKTYATINESKIPVVSSGGAGSSATIPPTRGSAARTSHHHMTLRGRSRIRYQRPNAGEQAPAAAQSQPCTVATARYYRDVSAIPTALGSGSPVASSASVSASSSSSNNFNIATRSASATLDLNSNPLQKTKLTSLNNNSTSTPTPPPTSNPPDSSRLSGRGSAELQAIIEHGIIGAAAKRNKRSLSSTRLDEYNTKLLRKQHVATGTGGTSTTSGTALTCTSTTNSNNNCKYSGGCNSNGGSFKLSRRVFGESGSSASTSASNSGIPTPTALPSAPASVTAQWHPNITRGANRMSSERDRDRDREKERQEQQLQHQQQQQHSLKLRKKISY